MDCLRYSYVNGMSVVANSLNGEVSVERYVVLVGVCQVFGKFISAGGFEIEPGFIENFEIQRYGRVATVKQKSGRSPGKVIS